MARLSVCLFVVPLLALGTFRLTAADDPKPKDEPKFEMSKEEKEILELTNKEREKEKLPLLEPHPLLFKAARGHSANMAKQEKMEHVLDDKNPGQRVEDAGYKWMNVGENIAVTDTEPPAAIVKLWMDSKLHRANILGKEFRHIGIGIAKNDKGETYYTEVFASPLKKQ
jgi:uncharacterized protein YkwD